jgi:hypothetical protein
LANGGYYLEDVGEYAMAQLLGKHPDEIPSFRRGAILDSLEGAYKTFRDTSTYTVSRSGGMLDLETTFGTHTFTQHLVPVDLEGEDKTFKIIGVDTVTPVKFVRRGDDLYLVYERNLARRVGG